MTMQFLRQRLTFQDKAIGADSAEMTLHG